MDSLLCLQKFSSFQNSPVEAVDENINLDPGHLDQSFGTILVQDLGKSGILRQRPSFGSFTSWCQPDCWAWGIQHQKQSVNFLAS